MQDMPKSEAGTCCGQEPGHRQAHTPAQPQTPLGCLVLAGTFGSCTPGLSSWGWSPQNPCLDLEFIPTASCPGSIRLPLSGHKSSAPAGCWGGRGWAPPPPLHQAPSRIPSPGHGCDAAPCVGSGARGCSGCPPPLLAGEGFLGAGWVPGSGLGTNNRSPSARLPRARGSSEQSLRSRSRPPPAQAGEHVRPPQPTSPAALPAPAEGGYWQLLPGNWAAAPPSRSQRWGLFPSLQLHQAMQSSAHRAGGICAATPCPCSMPAWWMQPQPDRAEPWWVLAATAALSPPSPRGWRRLWGAGRAFWGTAHIHLLGELRNGGQSLRYWQMSAAFPG